MKLRELLKYNHIVVQCHDNPDADAIASGYALYLYLKDSGKDVSFIYGGHYGIQKSNLVLMVEELHIPITHVQTVYAPELLVTVDCQYGESNVTRFTADVIAVIDHHQISGELPALSEVRSNLGSCSTLIWKMLKDEGYDVNKNQKLATALYYGLCTDTNGFVEVSHPLDRDLRDEAFYNQALITQFRNANLSLEELEIAGMALIGYDYNEKYRFAVVKAKPCDPNILGMISDLILTVDAVDACLVYSVLSFGIKFSVRSCVKEVKASELAKEICKKIGSGGGHLEKAGGFIQLELLRPEYEAYCKQEGIQPPRGQNRESNRFQPDIMVVNGLLKKRMRDYYNNCEVIYAKTYDLNKSEMVSYKSCCLPIGYVKAADLFPARTTITIRTVEEDLDITIEEDTILIIGLQGEVYPDREESFFDHYTVTDQPYVPKLEYTPTVKNNRSGHTVSLLEKAKTCIPTDRITVLAKKLDHTVKVFTEWDESKYMRGDEGDYLVVRGDNAHDIYIYERENFEKLYEPVEKPEESKVKAVVFDLDGTLLDSLRDLEIAVNYALEKKAMPTRTLREVRMFVGNGVHKLMERSVENGADNPEFEEVFRLFWDYYREHCTENTQPYPGIMEMMEKLKQRNIQIAIVSNKREQAVRTFHQRFFADYVAVSIGESEKIAKKPAPDAVLAALEQLGVDKEHAVYVGDSEVDIQTAENAGVTGISVAWGFRSREELFAKGATQIIDKPKELIAVIDHK